MGVESKSESEALWAHITPWLYIEPSNTWFWPVYSSCWSCYLSVSRHHATLLQASLKFLHLYTVVHLLLEEFRMSLNWFLNTRSVCHIINLTVGAGVWFWVLSRSSRFFKARTTVLNFLTPESGPESHKNKDYAIHILVSVRGVAVCKFLLL